MIASGASNQVTASRVGDRLSSAIFLIGDSVISGMRYGAVVTLQRERRVR